MGTYMEPQSFSKLYYNSFVFDLEYVGTNTELENCYIWEIGVKHIHSQQTFSITIDPGIRPIPEPFSPEFLKLTPVILAQRHATTFHEAWKSLIYWVNKFTMKNVPKLFMSHNCFKGDKIILEIELKRNKLDVPYNWFFFDTLIFSRFSLPKLSSYTLSDLYRTVFQKEVENAHSALPDAVHLTDLLRHIGFNIIEGPIYPFGCTSLQAVKWLGPSCEKILFKNNIHSLEELTQMLITSYSSHSLRGYMPMSLKNFISIKLTSLGIKSGNATSITNSLLERWL